MNASEMRLECLRLAAGLMKRNDEGMSIGLTPDELLEAAKKFYEWARSASELA